jgi:hypothetical protein
MQIRKVKSSAKSVQISVDSSPTGLIKSAKLVENEPEQQSIFLYPQGVKKPMSLSLQRAGNSTGQQYEAIQQPFESNRFGVFAD